MENQFQADNSGSEETTPAPAAENNTGHDGQNSSRDASDNSGGDNIMIPKHRFDEVNNELKEMKAQMESQAGFQNKLKSLFDDGASQEDPDVQQLLSDYKLPKDFVDKFGSVLEKRFTSQVEEKLRPIQRSTAEMHFNSELNSVRSKFPAIADWDTDKVTELRKTYASEERYRGLTLEEIVRLKYPEATTQTGSSYTAESSRGRSAETKGEKSISEMNEQEFEAWIAQDRQKKSSSKWR